MGIVHFLNVKEGDCHIIQHPSGRTTVIDVCNAYTDAESHVVTEAAANVESLSISGNFNQKSHPENPISYLRSLRVSSIFRFILTHPDMDHMDGIQALFDEFRPANFWDTDNTKNIDDFKEKYSKSDWDFYRSLRDGSAQQGPKRLVLYAGATGKYYNMNEDGAVGGDGLYVLSPTEDLIRDANEKKDWNDGCYVILYKTNKGRKVLFPGDAHNGTWKHLTENHKEQISDVDVLIAPHHGRDSAADFAYLGIVRPKLTLFGNASSDHLAYDKWKAHNLNYVTNNQAGTIILDPDQDDFKVYVTCKAFAEAYAKSKGHDTFKCSKHNAWYLMNVE